MAGVKKLVFLVALLALWPSTAFMDHNPGGVLPGVPNTPAIQKAINQGELVHCVNQAAASYPGFSAQIEETLASRLNTAGVVETIKSGVYSNATDARNAGCNVWHEGRNDNFCSGCAADVMYANAPATIRYKLSLGYVLWYTTIAHELGHVLGMHEGYDDVAFTSHILKHGSWASPWNGPTVMDVGTHILPEFAPRGVWQLTSSDKKVMTPWLYPAGVAWVETNRSYDPNIFWAKPVDSRATHITVIYWQEEYGYWWGSNELKDKPGHYVDCVNGRWIGVQANNVLWRAIDNTYWISCDYILGG